MSTLTVPAFAVEPITRRDRVRASYFGLKLPAAPVEAPAAARADCPRLTDAERAEVNAARNEAMWIAENDPAELSPAEVGDYVRRVEAEALAAVLEARGATEAEGPRPTAEDAVEVSPEDQAEALGYNLGYEDHDPATPSDWSADRRAAFERGVRDGRDRLHEETIEYHAWLDGVDALSPEAEPTFDELAEAGGVGFARAFES